MFEDFPASFLVCTLEAKGSRDTSLSFINPHNLYVLKCYVPYLYLTTWTELIHLPNPCMTLSQHEGP